MRRLLRRARGRRRLARGTVCRALGVRARGSGCARPAQRSRDRRAALAIMSLGAAAAPPEPGLHRGRVHLLPRGSGPRSAPAADRRDRRGARRPAGDTRVVDVVSDDGKYELFDQGRPVRRARARPSRPTRDDVALLLHTSGTTSRPKQVPLRHRNLLASARAIVEHYELGPGDVSYCVMPLFHVHGLVASTLSTLAAGGTVVVPRQASRRRFAEHLRTHRVTWFSAGPTLHHMLLEHGGDDAEFPDLRFIRSCSSACPPRCVSEPSATTVFRCSRPTG